MTTSQQDKALINATSKSTISDVRTAFEHGSGVMSMSQMYEGDWIYFIDMESMDEVKEIYSKVSGENSLMNVFHKILKLTKKQKSTKMENFTIKEGIELQTQNLHEWKSILTVEAFKHLETYVIGTNQNPKIKNGYDILRGSSLDVYVRNMSRKKYDTGNFYHI